MWVILSGKLMEARLEHPLKVAQLIEVRLSGKLMEVRLEHP